MGRSRGRRYTPSRRQNAPFSRQNLPHHPTAANAALYKARLIARRGKPPRRAPKTSVPRLFTPHPRLFTTYPRLFTTYPRLFTAHSVPFTTFPHLLRSSHVLSGRSVPFAAPPRPHGFCAICGASPAPLRLSYACLWPFSAICGASRACLRPIPRLLRLSNACLRTFCTFYAIPRPQKSASHPSRYRLHPPASRRENGGLCPHPLKGPDP